jgi:hypothetical protein
MAEITKDRVEKVLNGLIELHDDMLTKINPRKCWNYKTFLQGVNDATDAGRWIAEEILNPRPEMKPTSPAVPERQEVRIQLKKSLSGRSESSLRLEKAQRDLFGGETIEK